MRATGVPQQLEVVCFSVPERWGTTVQVRGSLFLSCGLAVDGLRVTNEERGFFLEVVLLSWRLGRCRWVLQRYHLQDVVEAGGS